MALANSSEVTTMPAGRVKWFNNAKGYGFILPEDESEDYFVHYSSVVMDGYKTLKAGQPVTFDTIDGPKGTHAINVRPFDPGNPDQENNLQEANAQNEIDQAHDEGDPDPHDPQA